MGLTFGLAIVEGPHADVGTVLRAFRLQDEPEGHDEIGDLVGGAPVDLLAVFKRASLVFALGMPVLAADDVWGRLSRDGGRVFQFHIAEDFQANVWAIYEQGRAVRWFDETTDEQGGGHHPLEPPADAEEHPADRIEAIFLAMVGSPLGEGALDFEASVPTWTLA